MLKILLEAKLEIERLERKNMDPLTNQTFLIIALDLVHVRILEGFEEELNPSEYDEEKVKFRIDMEMRKLGYSPKDTMYFAQAVIEEDQIKITEKLDIDTLSNMAINWLSKSYGFLAEEVIDEMRDTVYTMCHPIQESRDFINELAHEIAARLVNKSIEGE